MRRWSNQTILWVPVVLLVPEPLDPNDAVVRQFAVLATGDACLLE
jgi:hypothetical protein